MSIIALYALGGVALYLRSEFLGPTPTELPTRIITVPAVVPPATLTPLPTATMTPTPYPTVTATPTLYPTLTPRP